MQLNVCGPAYKHVYQDVNNQKCLNMYPIQVGPDGRGKATLIPTTGSTALTNLGVNPIRCMGVVGDYVYVVEGTNVHKLSIDLTTLAVTDTVIGTFTSTTAGVMYMAANPTQIIWVDGSTKGYMYTPGTGVFQEITATDSDFTGGGQVVFIDSYFVVNDPGTGQFYFSASNNGLNWDAADVATAETSTDNIVGLGVTKGELWVIGERSTEIWYNAANVSGSPFSLRTGLQMQIGCSAPASIVNVNDLLIWLDHRGFVVQSSVSPFIRSNNSGYDLTIISDEAITSDILTYARRDDAIAISYNDRGHIMYQITFPTANKTWVYDYTTKVWHERNYQVYSTGESRFHIGQFFAQIGTIQLMAGLNDGQIFLMSDTSYDDAGNPILRNRTTSVQYDPEKFRFAGVDRLELRVAIKQHSVPDPQITMRYSNDGGHTWSFHIARDLPKVGEYAEPVIWNRLGGAREWIFEFTTTEAIPFAIIDCEVWPSELED